MSITIDEASIHLTNDFSKAQPDAKAGTQAALMHCTLNANLPFVDNTNLKQVTGNAMTWKGKVTVSGPENEIRNEWTYEFLQFCDTLVNETVYAGRVPSEGSMVANYKLDYIPNPSLDADSTSSAMPFMDFIINIKKKAGTASDFEVTVENGDHPTGPDAMTMSNIHSPSPNFLFSMRRDELYTTIFVAFKTIPDGTIRRFLAHFTWHLIWHVEFKWTSPTTLPTLNLKTHRIDVTPVVLGGPNDARLAALLSDPKGPTANDLEATARLDAWSTRRDPILKQFNTRVTGIPPDFFPTP